MASSRHIGIGNWTEHDEALRLVVTLELRVGDMAGDLASRGFQTVEHEPCPPGALTLSVTHDVIDRRTRRRDSFVSGGAGIPRDCVEKITEWDDGWNAERLASLCDLADRWHLNTMRAGCAHVAPVYETDRYGRSVPSLDLTPPCPLTGYRYGSAWLVEVLPDEVLAELTVLGVDA